MAGAAKEVWRMMEKSAGPGFMPTNATLKLDLVTPVDCWGFWTGKNEREI
jgi:hypothetical protein